MSAIGPELLGRLYDLHSAALVLYARQLCDPVASEDVVHEAFLALARQRKAPLHPSAWLFRTVRNAAISANRGTSRRRRRETRSATPEAWFDSSDERLDAQNAAHALAQLDEETREIIVSRLWGGLSFEDVASLRGCSLATAHRRYHEGIARLQARLEPSWPTQPLAKNQK